MCRYTIGLRDIRMYAYHGVLPQENIVGNEYIINCEVSFDSPVIADDNLSQSISYVELYDIIKEEMQCASQLLETVCRRIRNRIRRDFPQVCAGYIQIEKLTPPVPGITGSAYVRLDLD